MVRGVRCRSHPACCWHVGGDPPPPWRAAARRELVLGWLQADFDGPAHWLNDYQPDPEYAEAAAAYAARAANVDPEGAWAWAHSVQGPWRQWAIQNVASQWIAREPEVARAALLRAGHDPTAIDEMAAAGVEQNNDLLLTSDLQDISGVFIGE
jgi:hypothetical protein